MGNETLPGSFKVHSSMCTKLKNLVGRIIKIFPDIEAARPGCSSGIDALCSLNNALERSKLLLEYCSESSKLYMAIAGDAIISRGCRVKILLEKSLSEIQSMVPVVLAVKISQIIHDLRSAVFAQDASEEEAGKAVRELMRQTDSSSVSKEALETKSFRFAALNLQLSTPKAIVIEKRSLKGLMNRLNENDLNKRKILKYLLYLLRKHESLITGDQREKSCPQHGESFADRKPNNNSICANGTEVECHHGDERDLLYSATPSEVFMCPLSLRLMYDPVIISSGETYERIWIEKWFEEGNDSCPKSKIKLDNYLLTPNTRIKDLISQWCSKYGIEIQDPLKQSGACHHNMDISSTTSIASLGSSMCNLLLPSDTSNASIGGSDGSCIGEVPPNAKDSKGSSFMPMQTIEDDSGNGCSDASHSLVDLEFLCGLAELAWDAQGKVVEDLRSRFKYNSQTFRSESSLKFVEPLVTYLKHAHDLNSVKDMRAGLELLLAFLTTNRRTVECLDEDALCLVSLLLESEVADEAVNIVEVLSTHPHGQSKIASSGSLASVLKILECHIENLLEQAIIILKNLSSSNEICLEMFSVQFIQKLTSFLQQKILTGHCLIILRNMCVTEKAWASVAKTTGCLASICELLEFGSHEDQENAVEILLLLTQKIEYCYLVMDEGVNVIPSLVFISNNGTENAKGRATELLRILQDIDFGEERRSLGSVEQTVSEEIVGDTSVSTEPTAFPKKSSLFRFKLPGLKKKR